MKQPLVTVGIALYNHENYIKECLDSVLAQTYQNIEIILIDDGSRDSSYHVAKTILEEQHRPYIVKTRENRGMCNTLNEIASLSKGIYISFIGSDDAWHPDKLEDQVSYLEQHKDKYLVHSNSIIIDGLSKHISHIDFSKKVNSGYIFSEIVLGKGGVNTPSHLFRVDVFKVIGLYDPTLKFEDTDFWLRLTKQYEIGYINKFHSYYRRHGENLSDNKNKLKFYNDEIIKIFYKNIDNHDLKKTAILRMYRKSFLLAFREKEFNLFFRYIFYYLKLRYFDVYTIKNNL